MHATATAHHSAIPTHSARTRRMWTTATHTASQVLLLKSHYFTALLRDPPDPVLALRNELARSGPAWTPPLVMHLIHFL